MAKFQSGAFVFYRTPSGMAPMLPSAIEQLAQKHGMPPSIVPSYAGDRQQVSRSITTTASKLSRDGWLLRPIKQSKHEVVYGIVQETKDQQAATLAHRHDESLLWSDEHGNGHAITGNHTHHAIVQQVDDAYQALRGKICAGDWTSTLTDYLTTECQGQAMREDGRVYWIPPQRLPRVHALTNFLAEVGIALVICEVESESRTIVQEAASEGLAEQLQALQDEVAKFDGTQNAQTYRTRIERYQTLRKRATTYQAALGIGVEQAQAILDALEAKVQVMLSLRGATIVKRGSGSGEDNTVSPSKQLNPESHAGQTLIAKAMASSPVTAVHMTDEQRALASTSRQGETW